MGEPPRECSVSDNFDDADLSGDEHVAGEPADGGDAVRFGDFSVLAPGVQIILYGRPVSSFGR